ncbi:MAG: D-aminoacylase [Candidatus Bathyarchaeota archaeon]|nr:D-aminoacylase [Candidatus Bathyarchaeota archaeon]
MDCDLIIKDGRIVDGTGGPWFSGDVAIKGEKIVAVGRIGSVNSEEVIDAEGLTVSPGFIDVHCHSEQQLLVNPQADSLVRQGLTTVINGVCGFSAAPIKKEHAYLYGLEEYITTNFSLGDYSNLLEGQGTAINAGSFVGHANCRVYAMGEDAWDRSSTDNELEEMKALVADAMEDGAFGLSTGLEYPPQTIITTDEIVELARVAARYGGIYATHVRSRDVKVVAATKEAIEIGERAGIAVEGSHWGARFPSDGKTKLIVELCEEARERGLDIAFDQVPWTTDEDGIGWCGCAMINPIVGGTEYTAKGREFTLEMLRDPEVVAHLKRDLPNRQYGPILAGTRGLLDTWDRLLLVHCEANPQYNMRNLREIGDMMGKDPFDALIDILLAEGENFDRVWGTVGFTTQWDTDFSLLHPLCSVTADTSNNAPYGPLSEEPVNESTTRAYGHFPYFFEKWVREDRLLTLEDAVRKCTGLPAQRVRIMDRGLLRPGMFADIVIFDPKTIKNKATWERPRRYPEGIRNVIVNGEVVVEDNDHTGALNGKVLRLNQP